MIRRYPASLLLVLALPLVACGDDSDTPPSDITDSDGTATMGSTSLTTTSTTTTDPTTSSTTDPTTSSTTDDPTTGTDGSTSTGGSTGTDGSTGTGGVTTFCGDGVVDDGETCDDGNVYDSDGCSADCQTATCLVPVTHTTVQDGIDDVACTTVYVQSGTYTEILTIDRSVTIEGQASPETIIDGNGGGVTVTVNSGVVTLRTLTVTGGMGTVGGGIFNDAVLTLDRTTVTNNTATGVGLRGAGVYSSGPLTLLSSEVSSNSASGAPPTIFAFGGGIYVEDTSLTITGGSLVADNAVSLSGVDTPFASGGGIHAENATVFITGGSVISGNSVTVTGMGSLGSTAIGGGIGTNGSNLRITGSTLSTNSVEATDSVEAIAQGGGLGGTNSSFDTGNGTVFDGNTATATSSASDARATGGAIFVPNNSDLNAVDLTCSTNGVEADATDGSALALGGAIHIDTAGAPSLAALIGLATLADNTADATYNTTGDALAAGAGLAANIAGDGALRMLASTASGNTVTSNDRAVGGAIAATSVLGNSTDLTFDIINSTFSGNSASGTNLSAGGAIGSTPDGGFADIRIASSTITGNTGMDNGGGLAAFSVGGLSLLEMQNSILYGNTSGSGADCYTDASSELNSGDYNVIGVTAGCDIVGTIGNSTSNDPGLGTLGDNGGPTQTIEITVGMSADDAGNPGGCEDFGGGTIAIDQRGLPRSDCDIGSYEIQ